MDRDSKGQFVKGSNPWNIGQKLNYTGHTQPQTEESRKKISDNRKGKMTGRQNHNFGGLKEGTAEKISKALKGRKLSPEHKEKIRQAMQKFRGKNNPNWKEKKSERKKYKLVLCPPEFKEMTKKDGMVFEHRLVMAKSIGRPLLSAEVVDHINTDTTDNRLENLKLFDNNAKHLAETLKKNSLQDLLRQSIKYMKNEEKILISERIEVSILKLERFTREGIKNIVTFSETLRGIHARLMMNGFKFENGRLTPPEFILIFETIKIVIA